MSEVQKFSCARSSGGLDQSLLSETAIADFLLAAWLAWMTPLLAALSSFLLVLTSSSEALSFSPAATASRKERIAVRSDDFTDWLRSRALSLVLFRLICDLMFATRVFSLAQRYGVWCQHQRTTLPAGPVCTQIAAGQVADTAARLPTPATYGTMFT